MRVVTIGEARSHLRASPNSGDQMSDGPGFVASQVNESTTSIDGVISAVSEVAKGLGTPSFYIVCGSNAYRRLTREVGDLSQTDPLIVRTFLGIRVVNSNFVPLDFLQMVPDSVKSLGPETRRS